MNVSQVGGVAVPQGGAAHRGRRLRDARGVRGAAAAGEGGGAAAGVRAAAPLALRLHPGHLHAVPHGPAPAAGGRRRQHEDTLLWVSPLYPPYSSAVRENIVLRYLILHFPLTFKVHVEGRNSTPRFALLSEREN